MTSFMTALSVHAVVAAAAIAYPAYCLCFIPIRS
jgi:hypothetical protein